MPAAAEDTPLLPGNSSLQNEDRDVVTDLASASSSSSPAASTLKKHDSIAALEAGSNPTAVKSKRLASIDLLRGFIMVLMAWDHSKDFLSDYKGSDNTTPEHGPLMGNHSDGFWFGPIDQYNNNSYYLFARMISHFCAPGFSLLMGCGMVLMSRSRRERAGWSYARLLWFFNLRGFILVCLGFVIRASMFIQMIHPNPRFEAWVGHDEPLLHLLLGFFQVMTSLGEQMIIVSWVLELLHVAERSLKLEHFTLRLGGSEMVHFRFKPICLCILSAVCFAATQMTIHNLQHGDPATANPKVATTFAEGLLRFVMVPGCFGAPWITMAYPWAPWLAICLLGCAMGSEFKDNPKLAHQRALLNGLLMLLAFVLIRTLGGSTLNLRGLPVGDATDAPLIGFWLVCKYPPSLAYTTLTVGADLVVLYLFSLMDSGSKVAHVILHYGRSPLAFYISHFYVINVFALIISASGSQGVPLPWVIPIWMVILFIEFFVCRGYDRFKHGKDVNSLWHLL